MRTKHEYVSSPSSRRVFLKRISVTAGLAWVPALVGASVQAGEAPAAAKSTAASRPVFKPSADGGFEFDTGALRGRLRAGGRSLGLSSVVHLPSGASLDCSNGLLSHYRVFTTGKRYGGGAWDWPSQAALREDGSVEVRWSNAPDRPFDFAAIYRWVNPATCELETRVRALVDLTGFESFAASYFDKDFDSASVHVQDRVPSDHRAGLLAAEATLGPWLMAPRDTEAVQLIRDGRWKLEPNPVDWVMLPPLAGPLAVRRNRKSGITATLMARPKDCFAVAMPHQTEGHYSVYFSLFGQNLKADEQRVARLRLGVVGTTGDTDLIRGYEKFIASGI